MTRVTSRPVLVVVTVILLVGVVAGVVWGAIAPTEHLMVVSDGRGILLTGESAHRFDALALFVCIAVATGVVSAVGSWFVASARGPAMTVAVAAASWVGSMVAAGVGLGVGRLVHPRPSSPATGDVISFAPGLSTPLAVLVQPLVAALVLVVLASLSRSDDLRPASDREADPESDASAVSSVDEEPRTRP